MRFDYRPNPDLPRLAWCAHLTRDDDAIVVHHGPWVETREDCFFEGAWNGPFTAGGFENADMLLGTGAKITETGPVFAAPSHPVERIYSVHLPDALIVSNSLVFLLVAADDQPDPTYADYFFDWWRNLRGATRTSLFLRTYRGRRVQVDDGCNLRITPDLAIERQLRKRSASPQSYEQLIGLLQDTVDAIVDNAASPERRQRFRPVSMISTGYDSPAVSVLASRAGCTEAVTFAWVDGAGGETGDDGSLIADVLGLATTRYVRLGYKQRTDLPEAEFCTAGPMGWAPLCTMEQRLVGSLLFTGVPGYSWHDQSFRVPPYGDELLGRPHFPYMSNTEFRLRVGYLMFPTLFIGAIHDHAIRCITNSAEMRPWVVPDIRQNKPILRRILEEAGVARTAFARMKHANAYANLANPEHFSAYSQADFLQFYADKMFPRQETIIHKFVTRSSRKFTRFGQQLLRQMPATWCFPLVSRMWWLYPKASHPLWRSPALYTFHWGFEHTKQRYQIGSAGIATHSEFVEE